MSNLANTARVLRQSSSSVAATFLRRNSAVVSTVVFSGQLPLHTMLGPEDRRDGGLVCLCVHCCLKAAELKPCCAAAGKLGKY